MIHLTHKPTEAPTFALRHAPKPKIKRIRQDRGAPFTAFILEQSCFIDTAPVNMPPLTSSMMSSKLGSDRVTRSPVTLTTPPTIAIPLDEPTSDSGSTDHVQELHKQLCQSQLRCNRLERERNEQSSRVQELEQLLNGYEADDPQEVLLTQSLQLAEALNTIETLKAKVHFLTQEKNTLNSRQKNEMMKERSPPEGQGSFQLLRRQGRSFRGIIPSPAGSENHDSYSNLRRSNSSRFPSKQHPESTSSETRRLAELHRTIMEKQIEALEQERNDYLQKCQTQASTISKLRDEHKLQTIKVEMLEQLVQSLNKPLAPTNREVSEIDASAVQPSAGPSAPLPALNRSHSMIPSTLQSNVNRLNNRVTSNRKKIQVIVNGEPAWYMGTVDEADGSPDGTGTIKFSNGDKYFGEVQHGEMHGHGTLYCCDSKEMKRGRFEHDVFLGR